MTYPTIHLNGTSKDELLRQWSDAYSALHSALEVLAQAAPNGRDYYPQGSSIIYLAQDEHRARMNKISSVMADLQPLCEHVELGEVR